MSRLLLQFHKRPRFTLIEANESAVDVPRYADAGYGDWSGFYDWLRHEGKIVGIRYWPFDDVQFLSDLVTPSDDLSVDSKGAIMAFFGPIAHFDESDSSDQAFEECRLLRQDGEYALVVGLSEISYEEAMKIEASIRMSTGAGY